jgi:hypothetical protein
MEYKEALKTVQAKKPKENFLVFQFAYDKKFVLPHKDGVALVLAMAQAEQLKDPYQEQHSIGGLDRDAFTTTSMSYEEYEQYKIAALLRIPLKEVRDMQLNNP